MPFYAIAILVVIVTGSIMWFVSTNSFIGYTIGITLGIFLLSTIVRKLGRKSQTSTAASSMLYKITRYKATVYHIHYKDKITTATVYGDAHEYADLLDILKKQMRFPAPVAKEATRYAMKTARDEIFEEKVRVALQYLGNGHKDETIKG